jgi:tetratricopeptide (TPR) repeat protein
MSATHPDETTLLRWVLGELPERRQAALKKHVARCRPCRQEREATRRLHERLSATGDLLAFEKADAFATRPVSQTTADTVRGSAKAMAQAHSRLEDEKKRLLADRDAELDLTDVGTCLATTHLLEEFATGDPSKPNAALAVRLREQLARGKGIDAAAERVVPEGQLRALAALVAGSWELFSGHPERAEEPLAEAWEALGAFDGPEHLVAWVEVAESLRRSYLGRLIEGRLLAERALDTFERYGLTRGIGRARHARAVALYYSAAYREAHREFHAALRAKDATTSDRARAVSGAAFCLAARGRFIEAAKEYSAVRRKLKGEGAAREMYLLQGEMKACLGTAGRWHSTRESTPAIALPESGGAFAARQVATEIVRFASEHGLDAAKERIEAAEGDPARGYVYLCAAQVTMPKVSSDPAMYVELAKAIQAAARSLPLLRGRGPSQPVIREQVIGEAQLLESNALNTLGKSAAAREALGRARTSFKDAIDDPFVLALADFYEGSAASFGGDFDIAWSLLRKAYSEFQLYGQENWIGRAESGLGTVLFNRGRNRSALHFLDDALRRLHPERDHAAYLSTLVNRSGSLLLLDRLGAAKASYAKALSLARRANGKIELLTIRYGLASIELKQGEFLRALSSFRKLAEDARSGGIEQRVLSAELRAAQCLGCLGQREEMVTRVRALRREIPGASVGFDPPLRELFAQVDKADLSSELVAHIVQHLETRDRDVQSEYRPFRVVKGGT